jgi:hypothetical protein
MLMSKKGISTVTIYIVGYSQHRSKVGDELGDAESCGGLFISTSQHFISILRRGD